MRKQCAVVAMLIGSSIGLMAIGSSTAAASSSGARLIQKPVDPAQLPLRMAVVVEADVVRSARVITRRSQMERGKPDRPDVIVLRTVNTVVHLDPNADYARQNHRPISQDHSLIKAQQLWHTLHNPGAYIVRNPHARSDESAAAPNARMIILRPDILERGHDRSPGGQERDQVIPNVPAPLETSDLLVAQRH